MAGFFNPLRLIDKLWFDRFWHVADINYGGRLK